jgi:hypothetical protein
MDMPNHDPTDPFPRFRVPSTSAGTIDIFNAKVSKWLGLSAQPHGGVCCVDRFGEHWTALITDLATVHRIANRTATTETIDGIEGPVLFRPGWPDEWNEVVRIG